MGEVFALIASLFFLSSCAKIDELAQNQLNATALQFITEDLTPAIPSQNYTNQILVKGGNPDYTYSLSEGSLPPGLSFSTSSGAITGVTSGAATGTYTFKVTVSDSKGSSIAKLFSIKISSQLTIVTSSLAVAQLNVAYNTSLTVSGGSGVYSYAATGLPSGINISASLGSISGTATVGGSYSVDFTVTDSDGLTAGKTLTLNVATPPVVTAAALPVAAAGYSYSATVAATNGITPYTFSISSGSLPSGLTMSAAGAITGTAAGGNNVKNSPISFTVQVTDSIGQTATRNFSINVQIKPWIPNDVDKPLRVGAVGVAYSDQLINMGGAGTLTYSATGLPTGLSISSMSGFITGTPAAGTAGDHNVVFTVTDANSLSYSRTKVIKIVASGKTKIDMGMPLLYGLPGGGNGQYNGAWPYPYYITVGDLNNDSKNDVIWAPTGGSRIITLMGNNDGSFSASRTQVSPTGQVYYPMVVDLNGDGMNDIVASTMNSNTINIWLGDNVWADNTIAGETLATGADTRQIDIKDINGDGKLDIAAAVYGGNYMRVFINCGAAATILHPYPAGPATPACAVTASGINFYTYDIALTNNPFAIALEDMDNPADGKLDMVVATYNGGGYARIYKGYGDGTFNTAAPGISNNPGINAGLLRVADFNGDGNKDVVLMHWGGSLHKIYEGNGAGGFNGNASTLTNSDIGGSGRGLDIADYDNDGDYDIAISQYDPHMNQVTLFVNDGAGFFTRKTLSSGYQSWGITFGDVTGDGKKDLLIPRGHWIGWSHLLIYKNLGSSFTTNYHYYGNPPNQHSATFSRPVAADLDQDNFPDVMIKLAGATSVYKNNGDGSMSLQNYQVPNGETLYWVNFNSQKLWDINGDGYWDYVSANGNGGGNGTVGVSLGNGDLTFGSQFVFSANISGCLSNLGARSVDVADINKDGKADVIVGTGCGTAPGAQIYIYYGYGDGTFNSGSPTVLTGVASYVDDLAARDFNGDGKVDIAMMDENGTFKIWRGNGDGTFNTPITQVVYGSANAFLEPGDFNADGILDFALASQGNTQLSVLTMSSTLTISNMINIGGSSIGTGQYQGARWVNVADMDQDGKLDILLGKYHTSGVHFFKGNNNGTFTVDNTMYQTPNMGPYGNNMCLLQDLNNDYLPDVTCSGTDGYSNGIGINSSQ